MKTKTLLFFFLLSLFSLSISSCNKDDDDEPVSKTELITSDIWNFDKIENYNDGNLEDVDMKTGYKMEFKTDNTLLIYKPDGNIDDQLFWDINADENKLFLSMDLQFTWSCNINKLTDSEFIFSFIRESDDEEFDRLPFKLSLSENRVYLSR